MSDSFQRHMDPRDDAEWGDNLIAKVNARIARHEEEGEYGTAKFFNEIAGALNLLEQVVDHLTTDGNHPIDCHAHLWDYDGIEGFDEKLCDCILSEIGNTK